MHANPKIVLFCDICKQLSEHFELQVAEVNIIHIESKIVSKVSQRTRSYDREDMLWFDQLFLLKLQMSFDKANFLLYFFSVFVK